MLREIINQLDKLPQKAMLNAIGTDSQNAIVAVIVENSEATLTNANNDILAQQVCSGIRSQNATPHVIKIPALDSTAMNDLAGSRYDLPQRDIVANNIEMLLCTEMFDSVVFVVSQPNVAVGMLLGAVRTTTPCAFVFGGTMTAIEYDGKQCGFVNIARQIPKIKNGEIQIDSDTIAQNSPLICGTDCERYGQNSIHCVFEALGLSLQGVSTATAQSPQLKRLAFSTGKLALEIAKNKLAPQRLITQNSLTESIVLDLAIEGSSTTMLNILAIAKALSIKQITLDTICDIAKTTPVLLSKQADTPIMLTLQKAGGVYSILKKLRDAKLIKANHTILSGKRMDKLLDTVTISEDCPLLEPNDKKTKQSANLRVLYGNLAEDGCFCQYHGEPTFSGVAKVYNGTESVIDALMHREIRPNDVVVIKNEGAKSAPGMREVYLPFAILEGMGLEHSVAVITDGRIPDFYKGIAVGHITPESYDSGLFAVLQDGDDIEISVTKGKISCDISSKELQSRLRKLEFDTNNTFANKYLRNWGKSVSSPNEGCVTK